jgi:hypothetical protein
MKVVDSDSSATPMYVHRQRRYGYDQDGWFTRIFHQGSDKFLSYFLFYIILLVRNFMLSFINMNYYRLTKLTAYNPDAIVSVKSIFLVNCSVQQRLSGVNRWKFLTNSA